MVAAYRGSGTTTPSTSKKIFFDGPKKGSYDTVWWYLNIAAPKIQPQRNLNYYFIHFPKKFHLPLLGKS